MSKLVRAKHPTTGGEFTCTETFAKKRGLDYDDKKPTRDRFGRLLPAKAGKDLRQVSTPTPAPASGTDKKEAGK